MLINRNDYKAIKRMDREAMSTYLEKVYRKGFEAGLKAARDVQRQTNKDDQTKEEV